MHRQPSQSMSYSMVATIVAFVLLCLSPGTNGRPQVSDVKQRPQAEANPILTTLASDPDLTAFYSLFNSTGGDSGKPGPGFEERFNNPSTGVKYTVFAPTNKALKKIPQAVLANLIRPSSFELLATILRNHIALGEFGDAEIGADEIITFVGGFSIKLNGSLSIESNAGLTKTSVPVHHQANLLKDNSGQPIRLQASNGAIFKIDALIDEFETYFGIDAATHENTLPETSTQHGTMSDILGHDPDLSELNTLLGKVDPDFLTRLSLGAEVPGVDETTVYLAPNNVAFDYLPQAARGKSSEPSNFGATMFLLGHGLGRYDSKEGIVRSVDGFNVTVQGGRVSNARVDKRVCARNGCVWSVGRWLDPIFT